MSVIVLLRVSGVFMAIDACAANSEPPTRVELNEHQKHQQQVNAECFSVVSQHLDKRQRSVDVCVCVCVFVYIMCSYFMCICVSSVSVLVLLSEYLAAFHIPRRSSSQSAPSEQWLH